jgi:hypothetical protein
MTTPRDAPAWEPAAITRREALLRGGGFGAVALSWLLGQNDCTASPAPPRPAAGAAIVRARLSRLRRRLREAGFDDRI